MEIKPLKGKFLGEVLSDDAVSKSGIHLVHVKKEIPRRVKILAVGADLVKKGKIIKQRASVGEIVYIKKNTGQQFELKDMKFIMIGNEDIIGKY